MKYSGIIKEILEGYPSTDVVELLEVKLEIPRFKAEVLAARITEGFCKSIELEAQKTLRVLEKQDKAKDSLPFENVYFTDSISEKEFEYFLTWLLEELGFKVEPEKHSIEFGIGLMTIKNGERIAVQALKTPKTNRITEQIVLVSQQAQKRHGCSRSIVIATSYFTSQAKQEANKWGIELWDIETLTQKISEVKNKGEVETQSRFPSFQGTLLQSLRKLAETKEFLVESKVKGKYDLHLPGVKYPLLTFYAQSDVVTRCVFRVKYNEPVGESKGEPVINYDDSGTRLSPNDIQAYAIIVEYLEQFLE